jgi:hypothetical protein
MSVSGAILNPSGRENRLVVPLMMFDITIDSGYGREPHFSRKWLERAYLLKEAFQQLWDYSSPDWAGKFLDEWCRQTMRSRIEPMKKIARSLRQHRELILNYFRAGKLISSGVVEGPEQ